jgi:phosphocarrier protein HPr
LTLIDKASHSRSLPNSVIKHSYIMASSQSITKSLIVQNDMGVHARPAAMIVRIANRFSAELYVEKDDEVVDGKSIMGLMMLAAGNGSILNFTAEGDDSEQMLIEIEQLFEKKFDEK